MLLRPEFERLRVVLVNPRNPLNIGAAARAMSNFGFSCLRVVNPYELAFREARSAKGAAEVLGRAHVHGSVAEAVADCTLVVGTTAGGRRELQHRLRRLQEGALLIRRRLASSAVALLFGSEKRGLSNDDLSHCHWVMRIPTREEQGSMNLGQAVAVSLYEVARDPKALPADEVRRAEAAEVERITAVLLDTLRASGYLTARAAAGSEEKIRRLVRRLGLTPEDAEVWLGIARQILWKIRAESQRQ